MPCFLAAAHIAWVVGPSGTASADSNHFLVDGGGEVGRVEDLLEAEDLHALPRRLLDQRHVRGDHIVADRLDGVRRRVPLQVHLNEGCLDLAHGGLLLLARSDLPGRDCAVGLGSAVAIEFPPIPHLGNHGEVELGGDQRVPIVRPLVEYLARAD